MRFNELRFDTLGQGFELSQPLIDRAGRLGRIVRRHNSEARLRSTAHYSVSVSGREEITNLDPLLLAAHLREWQVFGRSGRRRGTALPPEVTDEDE